MFFAPMCGHRAKKDSELLVYAGSVEVRRLSVALKRDLGPRASVRTNVGVEPIVFLIVVNVMAFVPTQLHTFSSVFQRSTQTDTEF